jgi:Outer membrane protein beta-barrel domain
MSIRRILGAVTIAAACATVPASRAQAQLTFSLGGGATWPVSSLSDSYTTGYNLLASLGIGMPSWPVGLRVDGMFNQNKSQAGVDAGTLQMWTVNADLVYNIVPMKVAGITPYLVGGAGYYNDSYHITASGSSIGAGGSTHDNDFGLNGGVGLRVGAPMLSVFVESRFHYVFVSGGHLEFIPLTVGLTF